MKNPIQFIFVLFMLCVGSNFVLAQPSKMDPPHAAGGMPDMGKTGVIEGKVFSMDAQGQKKPVSGQEITMLIFNEGQQVLMLKKITDEKGGFVFKNIFQNQSFAYGFGTLFEEKLYVFPRFSLGTGEDVRKIDFQIGDGSPYFRDPATMGMKPDGEGSPSAGGVMPSGAEGEHAHDNSWSKPYQLMAIGLGVLVAIAAAYFVGKKSAS